MVWAGAGSFPLGCSIALGFTMVTAQVLGRCCARRLRWPWELPFILVFRPEDGRTFVPHPSLTFGIVLAVLRLRRGADGWPVQTYRPGQKRRPAWGAGGAGAVASGLGE